MESQEEHGSWPRVLRTPQRARRRPAAMVVILPVLLTTAFYLGFFGFEDWDEALADIGRLTGVLMLAACLVTLLGVAGVLDHWFRRRWQYSGLIALLGAGTALVADLMLLVTTITVGDSAGYLTLWCVLAAGSAWAVITIYRTSVVIPAPRQVALTALVSTALAVTNFGYVQLYQPYRREPRPELQVKFDAPVFRQDRRAFALPVVFTFENRSDVGLYVLGTTFTVMGRRASVRLGEQSPSALKFDVEDLRQLSRYTNYQQLEAVDMGTFESVTGGWIDPRSTLVATRLVELPAGTPYDQLLVNATAVVARRDRMRLDPSYGATRDFSWRSHRTVPGWLQGTDFVRLQGRIYNDNAIAAHLQAPRYVTLWWTFNRRNGAMVFAEITRKDEAGRPLSLREGDQLTNTYGLSEVGTGWQTRSLWDIPRR